MAVRAAAAGAPAAWPQGAAGASGAAGAAGAGPAAAARPAGAPGATPLAAPALAPRRRAAPRRGGPRRRARRRAFRGAAAALALLASGGPRAQAKFLLTSSGDYAAGCFQLSVGTYTKDMSATSGSYSCSSSRCPPCFFFDTTSGPVQLTLQNCHMDAFVSTHGYSMLTTVTFTNGGGSTATVQDNSGNLYLLPRLGQRGSSMDCKCFGQVGNGILVCDATTTPVQMSGNIANTDHLFGDSCLTISAASNSFDVRYPVCAFKYCTTCFILDTSSNAVALTLTYCSYYFSMDQSSVGVLHYHFAVTGSNSGTVSDGTNVYTLSPAGSGQSSMLCTCSSQLLSCSADTVRATSASTGVAGFPEAVSVSDFVKLGSTLSVRGFTKLGSYLRLNDNALQFTSDANTYAVFNNGLQFYVDSARKMSMTVSTGTLHGTWQSDSVVTSSDARLKRQVEPLLDTLRRLQAASAGAPGAGGSPDPAQWLLMQLRPVSYVSVHDEAGGRRFGFLADELERVVPDMVRLSDDAARTKRVYLNDLVSVLVASAQRQHLALQALEERVEGLAAQLGACRGPGAGA